ncbi:MAG TPA: SDR family NAD(P)-dependent oxidoreductase, partial [Candidatus Binataceae bacterium]|nr:SDR family NAD(P)-dependent oxidoreductase [Candidatus Binataceae bacterium]
MTLRERGVYLITGGLGGLGLTLAEALARAVHARLVLLGRAAMPPRATWDEWLTAHGAADPVSARIRKLRDLELAGAEVLTVTADVTDLAAMHQAVAQAHAAFGELHGVIHAAGVLDDAPLLQKSGPAAARVIAPKLQGTLVLEAALAEEQLDFLVLMSSVSSILGPAGQIDYAAANAFLDAFARARTGQRGYPVIAIQWPRWREVGMAADIAPSSTPRVTHPLLREQTVGDDGETIYSTTLNVDHDWIVGEHRLQGGPALFPGCGYIEMIYGALSAPTAAHTLTIKNLYFTAPLAVRANADQALRLTVRKEGRDYRFSAQVPDDQQAGEWLECAQGEATLRRQVSPERIDLEAIRRRCAPRALSFDTTHQNPIQERYIAFGPRWRSLKSIDFGRDEALASVAMPPEFHADFSSYRIHPALLDMATGAAMFLIPDYASIGHLYVPASYGSITLYGDLPTKCYSHISFKRSASADSSLAAFDIVITNESGDPVIQIEDFLLREVRDPATLAAGTSRRGVVARPPSLRPVAAATVADGISSAEGVAAFHRVLAAPAPNIVVFPSDFAAAVSQANPARPQSRNVTATPGTGGVTDPVEATLLSWWRDLLGAENAGKDDDFFALGGQSLTAVRLLAKIKKTYRVDLDLAVLFKAPTVAKLAQLIRRDEAPATYRSIVPIRPAGTTSPLFLIHALGGRV